MERYGVSSGSLNSALTYGYSAGGYHFYRADEPKPDDSFFKSDNGGKGSSKKRPVICLETGVQFESAIAAVKWLDSGKTNNRGNMRTALISGSALLGYHFYYADEPKPPNSHFKRAVYCEDLDTVFTSLETCADAIGFNGSISDLADRTERNYLMALVGLLVEWFPRKDLSLKSLAVLLSLAEARENDENFKSALDLMFVQIEKGKTYSYVAKYHQYLWVPSTFKRNSDGVKPADCGGLFADEDFALLCWDSVNHLPAIRRISLKASLTSRLIDFKYLREAEAPAYTHGVSNDTFDYEFDDDDDDIPAFSVPEA